MHDGMPYGPIQGQGQGHGACEVPKIALRKFITLSVHLCLQHVCCDVLHRIGSSATADTCYK